MIPQCLRDDLIEVISRAGARLDETELVGLLAQAEGRLPPLTESADFTLPARRIWPIGRDVQALHGLEARGEFAAALVADLALRLCDRLVSLNLPESVLILYPEVYRRLVHQLTQRDLTDYWFGDDRFLKDLRIAGGYSVPCGSLDLDLFSAISRRSGLKAIAVQADVRNGWVILRKGGTPWFRIHVDERYLDDFNEAGREASYRRVAALLEHRPGVKGMVGTSWYYDPQVVSISPRLAYLQSTPTAAGAFLLRHRPGSVHTDRAIAKSATRRSLVDRGFYTPCCYSLVWPREQLLRWALSKGPIVPGK